MSTGFYRWRASSLVSLAVVAKNEEIERRLSLSFEAGECRSR